MLYRDTITAIEAELLSKYPVLGDLSFYLIEDYYIVRSDYYNIASPDPNSKEWHNTVFMFLLFVLEDEGV